MADNRGRASGPPAGWYPDNSGPSHLRWWDGQRWTIHMHPRQEPCSRCGAPESAHAGGRCPTDAWPTSHKTQGAAGGMHASAAQAIARVRAAYEDQTEKRAAREGRLGESDAADSAARPNSPKRDRNTRLARKASAGGSRPDIAAAARRMGWTLGGRREIRLLHQHVGVNELLVTSLRVLTASIRE
jgi:hypothetical protein